MYCPQCGVETGDIAGLCDKCRDIEKQENIRKQKIAETHNKIKVLYLVGIGMLFIQMVFMYSVPSFYINALDLASTSVSLGRLLGGAELLVWVALTLIAIVMSLSNRSKVEKRKKSGAVIGIISTLLCILYIIFASAYVINQNQMGVEAGLTVGAWLYIALCIANIIVFFVIIGKINYPVLVQNPITVKKTDIVSKWVNQYGVSLVLYSDGRYTMVNRTEPSGRWEAVGDKKIRLLPDSGVVREIDIETDAKGSYINLGGYELFYKDVYPDG